MVCCTVLEVDADNQFPQWFHMRYKQGRAYTPEAYANDTEYFKDVAKAYSAELQTLYDAGLRNVQFDDPGLACK
jgi:methionine synthase II (cobalamin-independent)